MYHLIWFLNKLFKVGFLSYMIYSLANAEDVEEPARGMFMFFFIILWFHSLLSNPEREK